MEIVPSGCAHNCGGHCVLKAWVEDGRIVRITTDDRPDDPADPQLRACMRGRSYLRRVYHPDRLLHPLRRVGRRGDGRFERISWSEAIDLVASAMVRTRDQHGPASFLNMHGTGGSSLMAGSRMSARLLNLFGGQLNHHNSYSSAAARWATPFTLGTDNTGHSPDDWVHSTLIILWGYNPAETIFGTNTSYRLQLARRAGARIIVIDPRLSMSVQALADEWIALRPGTDSALMDAMAYVMLTERLHDQTFLDRYCVGFDEAHLPPDAPPGSSYASYLLGTADGVAKTPEWAERYTQVPRERITSLAREYAGAKPAALLPGLAFNRRAYGEQPVRGSITLAAMTGNIGIPGGSPGGVSYSVARTVPVGEFPVGTNPITESIPVFLWTDAIVRGTELGAADGVQHLPPGRERLSRDVRFLFNVAGNTLINQHANINRTARILQDPALVDFVVVVDQFLTSSARFADVVLPATTWFEKNDLCTVWGHGDSVIFMNQAVEPLGECRTDYEICAALAARLGFEDRYTEGKTELAWLEELLEPARAADSSFPPFGEFRRRGVHVFRYPRPHVALRQFREDPDQHPLATPTGKVEIYSTRLAAMNLADVPPVARFIPEWEGGPWDPLFATYPLQAFGRHVQRRTHSIYDNEPLLERAMPHRAFINTLDAEARGIENGDLVRVFNDRGEIRLRARVTRRIMPGVVDVPQGAWWTPDEKGIDHRGNINVLASERPTPGARGNAQHTMLVEVERVRERLSDFGSRLSALWTARQRRGETPVGSGTVDPAGPRAERRESNAGRRFHRLAFLVDLSSCSGCKTCQVACQDVHGLAPEQRWRRVVDVEAGEWQRDGEAWRPDVAACSLSLSCQHCASPACVPACPSSAIHVEADGAVVVDAERCLGCRYCSWACPYGAPQFAESTGTMTKCDFCVDERRAGREPACVTACPLRAIEWGEYEELKSRDGVVEAMAPLVRAEVTRPSVLFKPPRGAARLDGTHQVSNAEEIGR